MRALLLALLLAACATPEAWLGPSSVRSDNAMAPLAPFLGCWRGAFEGTAEIHDERCFEAVLDGQYVRDTHAVRPTDYSGETVYLRGERGGLAFRYAASDGGMSAGDVRVSDHGLVFPPHTYTARDGATQRLRSAWTIADVNTFVVVSEREVDGVWQPWGRITYTRMH